MACIPKNKDTPYLPLKIILYKFHEASHTLSINTMTVPVVQWLTSWLVTL